MSASANANAKKTTRRQRESDPEPPTVVEEIAVVKEIAEEISFDDVAIVERVCRLEECDRVIPTDADPRRVYCSDPHALLARVRRHRRKVTESTPFLVTAMQCPVDGTYFAVDLHSKRERYGKKYDCRSCREIARQLREHDREMNAKSEKSEKSDAMMMARVGKTAAKIAR